ncbi:MAG TPA: bifunctional oligoribonuclease/PAP phosphatase NrnA [Candidatus Andersenbacteria bacterium]|nr:bifunctional oligoribonuclease/PAP phosphatase NrnA [Candidatus Andersenbacteria bacterium]
MKSKQNPAYKLLAPYEETVRAIADTIKTAKKVLIGTHEHPDGDALGSSLGLLHALESKGITATVYIPDPAADFFQFIPGFEKLTTTKPNIDDFDTVILLDYTQLYRTHLEQEVTGKPRVISIDHHYDNTKQAAINLIVPEAAATAHILFPLLFALDIAITPNIATCLLTGIFTDTGSFMHDSVTPEILQISSYLMQKGARLSHIAHETYQKKELSGLQIWGRALSRILISKKTGAAVSIITKEDLEECNATLDDLSGVVSMLNALPETTFAMLLVEYEYGKIKGSLRSEPNKGVDVSKIAKRLGGGGHKLASGFEVYGHLVQEEGNWRIIPVV